MFSWPEFELLAHVVYPEGYILISAKATMIWNHNPQQVSFQVNYCGKYYTTYSSRLNFLHMSFQVARFSFLSVLTHFTK